MVLRLRESLGTADKRIVAVVATLFLAAFTAANYDALRAAGLACAMGEDVLAPYFLMADWGVSGQHTSILVESAMLCPWATEPSTTQLILSYGSTLSMIVFSGVALVLLCWFLWGAVRPGLHSPVTPGRLRTLGWFVLVAGPVATALKYWFTYELAESLMRETTDVRTNPATVVELDWNYGAWLDALGANFPWWCVFVGVTALIVARLLRIEVRMAEELEGTI
jgi:hypothetical protein